MKSFIRSLYFLIVFSSLALIPSCGGGSSGSGTYSVTYDANGADSGSVPIDKTAYTSGEMVTVLDNTGSLAINNFTKVFAGWNTSANGNGTTYTPGNTFSIVSNVTLYAVWKMQGNAVWAQTLTTASDESNFYATITDAQGNVYAAGNFTGTGSFEFGDGSSPSTSVTGKCTDANAVLVKYNALGKALWAKTLYSASSLSLFKSIAVDSAGNVYVAGRIYGTGSFAFGEGSSSATSVTGKNIGESAVIVKYDASGKALWAKTLSSASSGSKFYSVTVDSNGNAYTTCDIDGTGSYEFGDGSSSATYVTGKNRSSTSVVIKYDSSGKALWAKTPFSASDSLHLYSIAVDSVGNVYTAGFITGTGSFEFGDGSSSATSVTGKFNDFNAIIVKYNASGKALWAKTLFSASSRSQFYSIAVDSAGNAFTAGIIYGNGSFEFGDGSSSATSVTGKFNDSNAIVAKYDTSGKALWAKTLFSASDKSQFDSIAVDSAGNVFAVGYVYNNGAFNFGDGSSSNTSITAKQYLENAIIVRYDTYGRALQAKTLLSSAGYSEFCSIAIDSIGNAYTAGCIKGKGVYDFGDGSSSATTVTAKSVRCNAVIVKY